MPLKEVEVTHMAPALRKVSYHPRKLMARSGSYHCAQTRSSPRMIGTEGKPMTFPRELQDKLALMRSQQDPERWMGVVIRRQKLVYAVGQLIQVNGVRTRLLVYKITKTYHTLNQ